MNLRKAAEQALDELEGIRAGNMSRMAEGHWGKAIDALRAALAEPVILFDGMTPQEFVGRELYEFQEATGYDTAAEYKAALAEPIAQLEQDGDCKHCVCGCSKCDARIVEAEQARAEALARSYESGYYAGVNAEREACAKVCEVHGSMARHAVWMAEECAALIRARGKDE